MDQSVKRNVLSSLLRYIALACLVLVLAPESKGQGTKTEQVILITLDGMRWQEVFTGAESRLITKKFVSDSAAVARKYWRESPVERRQVLMPFLWGELASKGQLYGNRDAGSLANVSNKMWFSYPGYNEILTGAADDQRITSNDKMDNPNITVLEFLNQQPKFKGKVAAFSSWDCFPYIINEKRSGVPVNAGQTYKAKPMNGTEQVLNELMDEIPNPLGSSVRLDAFTFHYALEYLKQQRPKVMYIAFDETDDFAHGGKYDLYLDAAHYADLMISKLWAWVQSDPEYKDRTALIITVDHGRGHHDDEAWRHHGIKVADADQIWIGIIGPDTPATGEMRAPSQVYQKQVAATLAKMLGCDFGQGKQVGKPIAAAFKAQP